MFLGISFRRYIFEKVVVEEVRKVVLKIKIDEEEIDLLGRVKFYK